MLYLQGGWLSQEDSKMDLDVFMWGTKEGRWRRTAIMVVMWLLIKYSRLY